LLPPGTMVELPSFGLDTLGRALALGGTSLLQTAIENLLGVRLGSLTVTSDAQLAALVAPAGPLTVDVPTRVEQVDPAGRVSMLWDAGTTALAPSDVPRFLAARGTGSDLARMARHQAFWTAWLARIRQSPSALAGLPDGLRRIVQSLASAPPSFDT